MCFNAKKLFVFLVFVLLNVSLVDAVVINEVMYAPNNTYDDLSNEWVELYNPSNESVDVSGWILNRTTISGVPILENTSIEPLGYMVYVYNYTLFSNYYNISCPVVEGIPRLLNRGDLIKLWNNTALVDSVDYTDFLIATNNNKTLSRKNVSLIFDSKNVFAGEPTPCAVNFKNTSADVRVFLDGDKLKVFPDDAEVVVDYSVKSKCLGMIVSSGTTNQTSFDLGIDFGKVHVFANITHIGNYNDTNESNNFLSTDIVLLPTTKTRRIRVWTDNKSYELNSTLNGCVEIFSNSTNVSGNITLKIGREKSSGGYDYKYFLNDSDAFSFSNYTTFNFSWVVPEDAIEGNYKAYSRFDFLNETGSEKEYNSGNTGGKFYINGLEDLGDSAIRIMSIPEIMKFGEMGVVLLNFSSNNDNYDSIRFVAYSSKHLSTGKTQCVSKDLDSSNLCTTPYNSIFAESYELKNVFRGVNMTLGVPVFLKDNCDKHYKNGKYKFYVKAFYFDGYKWRESAKTDFNLSVSGIIKDNCKTTVIKKSTITSGTFSIVKPKKIILELTTYSKYVVVGDDFQTSVQILNTGQTDAIYTIQSYVYNRSRLLSEGYFNDSWNKGWDANKYNIVIPANENVTIVLENRIKEGINSGNFTLKVKIVGEKTYEEKRVIEVIAGNLSKKTNSTNLSKNQTGIIVLCDYFLNQLYVNITNPNDKRVYLRLLKDNETEKNIYIQANQTREFIYKNQAYGKHFIILQDKKENTLLASCAVNMNNTAAKNKITAALFENRAQKNIFARFFEWLFGIFM